MSRASYSVAGGDGGLMIIIAVGVTDEFVQGCADGNLSDRRMRRKVAMGQPGRE